jgi:hypothetical protein
MEELREDTLGKTLTKSFGSGGGRKWRSPTVTALGERDYRKKERNKRKKKRGWPNWYSNKAPASLAPYCVTRAPVRLTSFLSTWHDLQV